MEIKIFLNNLQMMVEKIIVTSLYETLIEILNNDLLKLYDRIKL